jgi:hypothetical protein
MVRTETTGLARRLASLVGVGATAALIVTGLSAPASAAPMGAGGLSCNGITTSNVTPPEGKLVRDRWDYTSDQLAQFEEQFQSRWKALKKEGKVDIAPRVDIPVVFHVIRKDGTAAGGNIPRTMIRQQMKVLNHAYRGKSDAVSDDSARTPFHFNLAKVTRTTNANWFLHSDQFQYESAMKTELHEGGYETLNIYLTNLINVGLLGYAYLPEDQVGYLDGVVMETQSMPGGSAQPYDEGDTATHEVGHWMGLLHTFDNGCNPPGDYVEDTPYEAEPQFDCAARDSCPSQPGMDPYTNFMDYPDDACMDNFTKGQRKRMKAAWYTYRDGGGISVEMSNG